MKGVIVFMVREREESILNNEYWITEKSRNRPEGMLCDLAIDIRQQ